MQRAGFKVRPTLLRRELHPLYDALALQQLVQVIRLTRPDIVHTHSSKAGFLGRLAARRCGVPAIVHTPNGLYFLGQANPTKRRFYLALERLAARWSDVVIATSASERDELLRWRVAPPDRIVLIENGVEANRLPADVDREAQRATYGIAPDTLLVGTLARATEQKNPLLFVRAAALLAARFPHVLFMWIGDGDLLDAARQEANVLGISERCRFLGHRDDGSSLLAMFDLFWLPSQYEGLPLALLEAMALSIPVIATDVVGNRDVVISEQSGLLVPPDNATALAEATTRLLTQPGYAAALGRGARARLLERFTVQQMVARTAHVYERVVADHPAFQFSKDAGEKKPLS
jgi:glycosyltransferase involved in cell wall biosynthesis